MPTVIVPIGFDLGPVYDREGPVDRPPLCYEVHFGAGQQQLTATEYTAWLGAFADPEAHASLQVDRKRLEQYLRDNDAGPAGRLADPTPVVSDLLDRELLLEYDTDGSSMEEVFGLLRLYPKAVGCGIVPDQPDSYGIGYAEDVFVEVSGLVYGIWAQSPTLPSLWDMCSFFVQGNKDLASPEQPFDPSVDEVARATGYAVPILLSTGAAFLDPVNYELPTITPVQLPRPTPAQDRRRGVLPPRRGRGSPLIAPVGFPVGEDVAEPDPSGHWHVRFGGELARLTLDELDVWAAAAGDLERAIRQEITRDNLEEYLRTREDPVPDADRVISRLLDRGLLVEVDLDGPLEELFRALQLYPLGRGLGNTREDPDSYGVGIGGVYRHVLVPVETYVIWSYSLTSRSLWDACVTFARGVDEDRPPGGEPGDLEPGEIARMVAAAVPALITAGCAYLDPLNYET